MEMLPLRRRLRLEKSTDRPPRDQRHADEDQDDDHKDRPGRTKQGIKREGDEARNDAAAVFPLTAAGVDLLDAERSPFVEVRRGHLADQPDREDQKDAADHLGDAVILFQNALRKHEEPEQKEREHICGQAEKPEERAADETAGLAHQADAREKHEQAQRKQEDPLQVPRNAVRGVLSVGTPAPRRRRARGSPRPG